MNASFQAWAGQVTTGHGVMVLAPTLMAVISGSLSWSAAIPFLIAGVVGLLWPENPAAVTASKAVANDVEALIAAYRTGLSHAETTPAPAGSVPAVPPRGAAAAGLATLALTAMALGACSGQTPAQQQAAAAAVASGLVCVADATGKVVAAASTTDPNAVKVANAMVAAGGTLTTDAACQSAIANGAVALAAPAPTVTAPTVPVTNAPVTNAPVPNAPVPNAPVPNAPAPNPTVTPVAAVKTP
jgi:hypothetical protein